MQCVDGLDDPTPLANGVMIKLVAKSKRKKRAIVE